MFKIAYRFLLMLIVFAVIGGPIPHFAQPAAVAAASAVSVAMADLPCDMAMPMANAGQGVPMAPCKGMTPGCIKQMCCVASIAFPARLADNDTVFVFSPVAYWSAWSEMAGVALQPELLPPRTA